MDPRNSLNGALSDISDSFQPLTNSRKSCILDIAVADKYIKTTF